MAKQKAIEIEGVVSETLPDRRFRVRLDNGHEVLATIAGRMRRFKGQILPEDRVRVKMSPYDLTRGRIVFRIS